MTCVAYKADGTRCTNKAKWKYQREYCGVHKAEYYAIQIKEIRCIVKMNTEDIKTIKKTQKQTKLRLVSVEKSVDEFERHTVKFTNFIERAKDYRVKMLFDGVSKKRQEKIYARRMNL